jgi:disulfide bond formation protein DsbB
MERIDEINKKGAGQRDADTGWYLVFAAWLVAMAATLGSLYFSEGMGIEPCELCWYQRIFMYPLVPVLIAGLYPADRNVVRFGLPLAVLGLLTAFYHWLLHVGVIPQELQPCGQGNACSQIDLELFGFVTLPMLSMLSFAAIISLLLIHSSGKKR